MLVFTVVTMSHSDVINVGLSGAVRGEMDKTN